MMSDFTLYLDEAGLFVSPRSPLSLGLRVVAGVLLRGDEDEHCAILRRLWSEVAAWVPGPVHAAEWGNPIELAKLLKRAQTDALPLHLAALQRRLRPFQPRHLRYQAPDVLTLVERMTEELFQAACRVVGRACAELAPALLLLCAERDLEPGESRYPEMVDALTEHAIRFLTWDQTFSARLRVVAEAGGPGARDGAPALFEHVRRFQKLSCSGAPPFAAGALVSLGEPAFCAQGKEHPVLPLADFVAYALGPRDRQDCLVTPQEARAWSLRRLEEKARTFLGEGLTLRVVGAGPSRKLIRKAETGGISIPDALARLDEWRREMPPGMLMADLESTAEILSHLKELGR
jgi:hypothetical protein